MQYEGLHTIIYVSRKTFLYRGAMELNSKAIQDHASELMANDLLDWEKWWKGGLAFATGAAIVRVGTQVKTSCSALILKTTTIATRAVKVEELAIASL